MGMRQVVSVLYSSKFLRHTIFADCVTLSILRNQFWWIKEILLATPYKIKICGTEFLWLRPTRQNRENCATQKFGAIRYIETSSIYQNHPFLHPLPPSLHPPPPQIANIGPASYNYDETLNTLRYANRAKNIQNKAHINEDPKDAMLREFQKEIEELKQQLAEASGSEGGSSGEDEVGEGERKKRGRRRKHRKRPLGETSVCFSMSSL